MPKIKSGANKEKKEIMSEEMIKKCKNDIAKFGFGGKEYVQFLISVKAMKDENVVLKYPNSDIDKYHKMYLEKNESGGDNDLMVLHSFKITTCDDNDNHWFTGYFAPRSFWDKILETKLDY